MQKILIFIFFIGLTNSLKAQDSLPPLNLEIEISISGFSSGGYMATQFHLSYPEKITAVGIIGAGPYYCSKGSLLFAQQYCLNKNNAPPTKELINIAKKNAAKNVLGNLTLLSHDKIWLFHGTKDEKVSAIVSAGLNEFYQEFIPTDQIKYVDTIEANHGFPTLNFGSICSETQSPFINNCKYDAAGEMLNYFYKNLAAPANNKNLPISFDQTVYNTSNSGLSNVGYIYIPRSCMTGSKCKLHISFHGCAQNYQTINDKYVTEAGFNRWAETNNMVVLYPQVKTSIRNPYACWDWWGYTGSDFATKNGKQIQSIKNMMDALQNPNRKT